MGPRVPLELLLLLLPPTHPLTNLLALLLDPSVLLFLDPPGLLLSDLLDLLLSGPLDLSVLQDPVGPLPDHLDCYVVRHLTVQEDRPFARIQKTVRCVLVPHHQWMKQIKREGVTESKSLLGLLLLVWSQENLFPSLGDLLHPEGTILLLTACMGVVPRLPPVPSDRVTRGKSLSLRDGTLTWTVPLSRVTRTILREGTRPLLSVSMLRPLRGGVLLLNLSFPSCLSVILRGTVRLPILRCWWAGTILWARLLLQLRHFVYNLSIPGHAHNFRRLKVYRRESLANRLSRFVECDIFSNFLQF